MEAGLFDTITHDDGLTLRQLALRARNLIATSVELQNRWVTAMLTDVHLRKHCYMELIEKDEQENIVARMRATIWAGTYNVLARKFRDGTGQEITSGLKVRLRGSVTFHEQYGISFNVSDIDPDYTLGGLEQKRREILRRLTVEGAIGCNKALIMPDAPQRIAIISARGAAGYGDFMHQLEGNPYRIVFYPCLFEAVMQGEKAAPTVIDALQRIEETIDLWDCVVIIRGGGSSTDLTGFDDLELARRIATFRLPIIVGIGHERDRTVLDEIAHTRVKTPTAAAEYLVNNALNVYARIEKLMQDITTTAKAYISGSREQLAQLETRLHADAGTLISRAAQQLASIRGILPQLAARIMQNATLRLDNITAQLPAAGQTRLQVENQRLYYHTDTLRHSATTTLARALQQLEQYTKLTDALSPQQTLRRGYSITLHDGKAVTDATQLPDGAIITTRLHTGKIISTVQKNNA